MDYIAKDTALTATADAIRSKTGTTEPITWDEAAGFSGAVNAIPEGEDLTLELTEQEELIATLQETLKGKATGGGGDPDLPTGYRRVDYIKFSDAQMVDTGIVCNHESKIKTHFSRDESGSVYLYGVASSNNTASITAYLGGNWRFGSKYGSISPTTDDGIIYTSIQDKTGVVCTAGNRTYSGVTAFDTVGTLIIGGARNSDGTVGVASYIGKIFLFEIWQGDELVLKLIPVTDGKGAYRFWDSIGEKFHDSITSTPLNGGNL